MTRRMVLISTNHPHLRFSSGNVLRALQLVYSREGKELPSLAVVFTHSRFIRKMNREFLMNDSLTDVIAFPLGEDGGVEGEIYINLDAARNQAREYSVSYTRETLRLLIHGALHLLGYEDTTVRGKKKMSEREEMYLELMKRKKRK
jgi:probable rRNA maturation factor